MTAGRLPRNTLRLGRALVLAVALLAPTACASGRPGAPGGSSGPGAQNPINLVGNWVEANPAGGSLPPAPVVDDQARAYFAAPVALPKDTIPANAPAVVGAWVPSGAKSGTTAGVTFHADGTWQGSDGCNGNGGVWAVGLDGRFLATMSASTLIGCINVPVPDWVGAASRAGLAKDTLSLFDHSGNLLGRLVPASSSR